MGFFLDKRREIRDLVSVLKEEKQVEQAKCHFFFIKYYFFVKGF